MKLSYLLCKSRFLSLFKHLVKSGKVTHCIIMCILYIQYIDMVNSGHVVIHGCFSVYTCTVDMFILVIRQPF